MTVMNHFRKIHCAVLAVLAVVASLRSHLQPKPNISQVKSRNGLIYTQVTIIIHNQIVFYQIL